MSPGLSKEARKESTEKKPNPESSSPEQAEKTVEFQVLPRLDYRDGKSLETLSCCMGRFYTLEL